MIKKLISLDAQLAAFKQNPDTDWQDAIEPKPRIQNYELSISGRAPTVNYLFSFNYLNQPGLILNEYYKKAIFRSNFNFKINSKIDAKVYVNVLMPKSRNTGYAGDITDPFAQKSRRIAINNGFIANCISGFCCKRKSI